MASNRPPKVRIRPRAQLAAILVGKFSMEVNGSQWSHEKTVSLTC